MGNYWSHVESVFPPAPKFSADDIPDMTGKVVLITGANTGLGKETARVLLMKNAKVYITARDQEKGEIAIKELKELTGKEAHFLKLNLANLKQVKTSAEEFLRKENQLHVLFNNAGVMGPPIDMLTDDGYDLQFGTNVLGHFYFAKLLLPLLLAAVKASPDGIARVVNVSSAVHLWTDLDFNTFKDSPARKKLSLFMLYGQSKHGNVVFSTELKRRYGHQGIVSTSLHPGGIRTDLQRHEGPFVRFLNSLLSYDVSYGALTQLYAGTAPGGAALNGMYLVPWARVGTPRPSTQDPQVGRELWAWMEEQVKNV